MLDARSTKIAGAVAFYFVTSLSLVFLNKVHPAAGPRLGVHRSALIRATTRLGSSAEPLLRLWEHRRPAVRHVVPVCGAWRAGPSTRRPARPTPPAVRRCAQISVLCGFLLGELGKQVPSLSFFPPFEYELPKAKQIVKVSAIFVAMITFNNLCLQYVEVHFYQVARSLSIFFNVLFSKVVLGQDTSPKVSTLARSPAPALPLHPVSRLHHLVSPCPPAHGRR